MTKYYIGKEEHYIDEYGFDITEYVKDAIYRDEERGFKDRMNGYYDKWYRYNRRDEGAAYDKGVQRAVESGKCKGDVFIIECMH